MEYSYIFGDGSHLRKCSAPLEFVEGVCLVIDRLLDHIPVQKGLIAECFSDSFVTLPLFVHALSILLSWDNQQAVDVLHTLADTNFCRNKFSRVLEECTEHQRSGML